MLDGIFNRTSIPLLERVLNISSTRQRVLASNIANVSTPGYARRSVDFEKSLNTAMESGRMPPMRRTEAGHMNFDAAQKADPSVVVETTGDAPDVEREMARAAENQLLYATAAKIIGGGFKSLRGVIRGRF